jgi:hypothetical protein
VSAAVFQTSPHCSCSRPRRCARSIGWSGRWKGASGFNSHRRGTPTLVLETSLGLPNLGHGAAANIDVKVPGARRGDVADVSLDTSSIAFVLDCLVWSNDSVRVTARNVSAVPFDLAEAALAVQVVKRQVA